MPSLTVDLRSSPCCESGVESLIEWRRKYDEAVSPLLLRCSVGLEEVDHLKEDLKRAIVAVSS